VCDAPGSTRSASFTRVTPVARAHPQLGRRSELECAAGVRCVDGHAAALADIDGEQGPREVLAPPPQPARRDRRVQVGHLGEWLAVHVHLQLSDARARAEQTRGHELPLAAQRGAGAAALAAHTAGQRWQRDKQPRHPERLGDVGRVQVPAARLGAERPGPELGRQIDAKARQAQVGGDVVEPRIAGGQRVQLEPRGRAALAAVRTQLARQLRPVRPRDRGREARTDHPEARPQGRRHDRREVELGAAAQRDPRRAEWVPRDREVELGEPRQARVHAELERVEAAPRVHTDRRVGGQQQPSPRGPRATSRPAPRVDRRRRSSPRRGARPRRGRGDRS
jgi:hypothetical protein